MAADALPFSGLRIVELEADLLSGRLTGMLFADQGAEAIILNSDKGEKAKLTDGSDEAERRANDMLNRNKIKPKSYTSEVITPCHLYVGMNFGTTLVLHSQDEKALLNGADVIIVDGERQVDRAPHQVN